MVEKSKIKLDPKKALEKLIVENSKSVKEKDKKIPAKESDKKVESKEDKKQKTDSKKLEELIEPTQSRSDNAKEVMVNAENAGVDLENLGLVKTNSPVIMSAPNSKLENSVKDVANDSDKKKDQNQAYSSVKDNYIQQQSSNYEQNKKTAMQHGQTILIPMERAHSLENSNILRGQVAQRNVQMIHNPELEKESRMGYEPYSTSKLDNTPKKPWEQQEDRIKKYK